jgi:hypothetical protein
MIEQTPEFLQKQEAFKIFYNQNLRNDFVQLEAIRTGYLQRFWMRIIGIILLISLVIFMWIKFHSFDDIGIIIIVSSLILFWGLKFAFKVAEEYAQKAETCDHSCDRGGSAFGSFACCRVLRCGHIRL